MSEILLLFGIRVLNIFLCVLLAIKLTEDAEYEMSVKRKIIFAVICAVTIADNVTKLKNLYFNSAVWITTDIYFIILFLFTKSEHRSLRTRIAILLNHVLGYVDYIIAFLLVTYERNCYTRNVVLYSRKIEIKILFWASRVILSVGAIILASKNTRKLSDTKWNRKTLTVLDIFSFLALFSFQRKFVLEIVNRQISYALIVFIMTIMFCIVFWWYVTFSGQQEQKRMMQIKNEMLEENYRKIYEEQKRLEQTAHDFKNHINLLERYLDEGRYTDVTEYIKKLKGPLEMAAQQNWSGNKMLDSILNLKLSETKQKKIKVNAEIGIVQELPLSEYDLCVILSNLLDNAIEACEYVEKEKKELLVDIKIMKCLFMIKVVNSIGREPMKKNGKYYTSKSNKKQHGIGLESVKNSVNKYHGTLLLEHTDSQFMAIISIPFEDII